MKVLYILADGPQKLADQMRSVQSKEHEIKVIDLSKKEASYDSVVDDIFSYDRVISWLE